MTPKQIKSARIKAGLSQNALAEILGTHAMTISKWETGARTPDSSAVAAIKMIDWARSQGHLEDMINYLRS